MAIRTISEKKTKQFFPDSSQVKVQWSGVRELQRDLQALSDTLTKSDRIKLTLSIDEVIASGAHHLRDAIRSRAEAQGWPHRVQRAIFAYTDLSKRQGKKRTAIVGVRSGAPTMSRGRSEVKSKQNPQGIYVEWIGKSFEITTLVSSSKLIGESLAGMWERGTKKMRAKPAIRPGLKQDGAQSLEIIKAGCLAIIRSFSAK